MRLLTWIVLALLVSGGVVVWRLEVARNQPPDISFARVLRENLTSSVPTDGRVEPLEWAVARAQRQGAVKTILVKDGEHVSQGQELARLDTSELEAEREQAQAGIDQAQAQLQILMSGGRAADLAKLNGDIEQTKLSLTQARADYAQYQDMLSKKIATQDEVTQRKRKVDDLEQQLASLTKQREALVTPADKSAAEASLKSAQAKKHLAEEEIAQSVVRAPIEGEIYQFDLKPGAFLNPGDAVASIGRLDRVKVTVFVDERDLGRVRRGMPVRITWDALPGRTWDGVVDKLPEQVVAKGSREVGEVQCVIENPGRDLRPGSNVNVDIRAESVENALTIPKEALRNENGQEGVYRLNGMTLEWRPLKLGIENVTRAQVLEGLSDGDAVALISDRTLKSGMAVTPVIQK